MSEHATPPKEMLGDFVQIGAVVRDLDRAMKVLSEVFGVGPFRTLYWPPAGRPDMQRFYHGQPADFTARMAFTELGPIELELIQPLEGESIWADFLRERGPGIHHIRFNTPDMDSLVEYLAQNGVGVAQAGTGVRPGTKWAYFDTDDLVGFTIEALKTVPGTGGRTPK